MQYPRLSRRSISIAAAVAVLLAAGSAVAIIAQTANIRGDSYSSSNPPAAGGINGKAAGLSITFSDENIVNDREGTSTTLIESNARMASVKHVLTQRTGRGPLRLTISAEAANETGDPAAGNLKARMLLKWVRMIADSIFTGNGVPGNLPPGVSVQLDRPDRVGPVVLNTLRVLVERHFIAGFAALGGGYEHALVDNNSNSVVESSLTFGPTAPPALDVSKLSTRVNETVTNLN